MHRNGQFNKGFGVYADIQAKLSWETSCISCPARSVGECGKENEINRMQS